MRTLAADGEQDDAAWLHDVASHKIVDELDVLRVAIHRDARDEAYHIISTRNKTSRNNPPGKSQKDKSVKLGPVICKQIVLLEKRSSLTVLRSASSFKNAVTG